MARRDDIASLIGVAVEHKVNAPCGLDTTADHHRLANVTRWTSCATRLFSNLSRCTSGKSTLTRCWLADGARRSSRRALRPLLTQPSDPQNFAGASVTGPYASLTCWNADHQLQVTAALSALLCGQNTASRGPSRLMQN
jgi:hypothetical protein